METIYEKINDYGSVKIRLASPEDIRSWSYGEVKKPETINYRTYRAEKDGLFCERIFGPEKDWECFCGKYKGIKHKGIVCDRCGVMITHSKVRRKRMGHINLAAPVVHIWFFKAIPSRLGNLLGMKTTSLEKIIYFQEYVVIDPGETGLKKKQLLTDDEYREAKKEYGDSFEAGMGAGALKKLLEELDLAKLSTKLRVDLAKTRSKQTTKKLIKRLKIVESLRDSDNKPDWMILETIPVIPPDLRPLVLLDSGNFATSDLNDLYRRLINRNNRLKKLLDLNAPEVIIYNEKRMLQQSVDALFDNNRCRRSVLGSSNRPLKSLTDMIKGKQGRFRENLLGKRVDYSARSVIVVGPELKLHQCGLPKKIALELFQPFIIRRLKEMGHANTIKSAKRMLERKDEEVWDILESVIKDHPVLLNRAPTLHRMGIQAFKPVLIEGNAIKIHPLICVGFNADFDGDQMAVHLPLSWEAQVEASTLMLSTHNIFSPANGSPIISPSQDIVLGCSYLTVARKDEPGEGKIFSSEEEVFLALGNKKVSTHSIINVFLGTEREVIGEDWELEKGEKGIYKTTVGRVVFNSILPDKMPFYNLELNKNKTNKIIYECHERLGREETLVLLDDLKETGFHIATIAGLSFSKDDMKVPEKKKDIINSAQKEIDKIEKDFKSTAITYNERYHKIIDCWTHAREQVGKEMMNELKNDQREGVPYLNPVYLMASSGARGSIDQIRQLAGMRGLMVKPSGNIIETPIIANFREGLKVLEYFSSTHGARKGLADTALKTADSGYLTRKLADVAQNVVVNESDCGTLNGITKGYLYKGEKLEVPISKNIFGRVARETIKDPGTNKTIVKENDLITKEIAMEIEKLGFNKIRVRSPLTCESALGVCSKCYGMDLSTGEVVEKGLAVGIIGAQSIGEPGTQLTMRTFHIGGTAHRTVEQSEIKASTTAKVKLSDSPLGQNDKGENIVLSKNYEVALLDPKDDSLIKRYKLNPGTSIFVKDDQKIRTNTLIARWDPHTSPIIAEKSGIVKYDDVIENLTMKIEKEPGTDIEKKVIIEHKGDHHPKILIQDPKAEGKTLVWYPIPEKAHLEVEDGERIKAGRRVARTPRKITGTQDITGGLPRVTEIFEARKPKEPSIMSEIDGIVELGEKKRGKNQIIIKGEQMKKEHLVPPGKHLKVHDGDRVIAGQALIEGPLAPQDILRIKGEESLQQYLLQEVQNVYRSQNVDINDKHIEIIIAQMLRKVRVEDPGDTKFLPGQVVDKFQFKRENEKTIKAKKKPASVKTVLMGITKAALQADSFISAASFQETAKVLTEAALAAKTDQLLGLKENVILGHMVPAGTGFKAYHTSEAKKSGSSIKKDKKEEDDKKIAIA